MDLNKPVKGGCVPRKELLYFAAGLAGQNIAYNLIAGWMFYFCTDVIYISSFYAGLIVGITRIWDGINDPIMGVFIDRHRFKSKEKLRPYLIYTPLLVGLFMMLIFLVPNFKIELIKVIYILFFFLLWDMLYTVQDIAIWGMTSVMTPISEERTIVSKWGRIGATVGSWLPGLIPLALGNIDKFNISERAMFGILGLVCGVGGMAISMFSYKAQERVRSENKREPFFKSLRLLFKNKIVMLLLLANILGSLSLTVPMVYFFKYKVSLTLFGKHINGLNMMFVYGLIVGLPGTLAMFIAPWIGKKVKGMINVLIIAQLSSIVMRIIAFFVGYEGNKILVNMLLMSIAGIPNGITSIASTSLWGDSLDYMEWKTGERAEAITFSTQNLIAKVTSGISTIISGILLTAIQFDKTKYDVGLEQSNVFNEWIWPLFILGPIVGAVLYLIPLLFLKYPESLKKKVEQELKIRREEKTA